MTMPLPGSVDEYEIRARLRRLVARGGVARDPKQAEVAVELAREQLAKLPRQRRLMLLAAIGTLAIGVGRIALGDTSIGLVVAAVGVAIATGSLLVHRVLGIRLGQAIRKNEELAAVDGHRRTGAAPPD